MTQPPEQVAREIVTAFQADIPTHIIRHMAPVFPDWQANIAAALRAARSEAIEECARVAEAYWKDGKNVYARHAGRAVETRIRALAKLGGERD